ncbi:hypothetical protein SLEP1_g15890 [Rubroshorea leprosula]|uniref:Serine aminopeptidase S33 domain-containing protein n=1 Tax=Rubroshorea leprosula TaxID=152421 RepID=A0AAV5IYA1_9ROSI|nr:hypothetical protein SLEP1_g15890 [Rubroshorea leprosula]
MTRRHQTHDGPHNSVQQVRVVVQNSHGENLVGILHETGSKEVVIICHGFQSSKERIPMKNLALALEREGISAFRFDFAGNGESEGSFHYGNYHRETEDLRAVILHFCQEQRLISAIVGHSKGGNVVLLYASKYNDVPIVVNISGRFNLERGMEGRLGKDFLQRIKQDGFIDVKNRKGKFEYRVTEESLIDRLTTDTCAACGLIHQDCRLESETKNCKIHLMLISWPWFGVTCPFGGCASLVFKPWIMPFEKGFLSFHGLILGMGAVIVIVKHEKNIHPHGYSFLYFSVDFTRCTQSE